MLVKGDGNVKKRLWMAVPVAAMILLLVLIGIRQKKQDTAVQISYNDMMAAVGAATLQKQCWTAKAAYCLK